MNEYLRYAACICPALIIVIVFGFAPFVLSGTIAEHEEREQGVRRS